MSVDLSDFDTEYAIANYPIKDKENFVKAQIVNIQLARQGDTKERTSKTLQDEKTYIVTKFTIMLEGAAKPIKTWTSTGTNLNPNKIYIKAKGRGASKEIPEYNAFTEMCLRLKIITIDVFEDRPEDISLVLKQRFKEVTEENPIYIKTKLKFNESKNSDRNSNFEVVDIKTIQTIDPFEFKNN